MIKVKVLNNEHELDTLNGYYRLNDLWKLSGSIEGLDPVGWMQGHGPHSQYSVQLRTVKRAGKVVSVNIWGNQSKLMEYSAFICPEFKNRFVNALTFQEYGDEARAFQEIRSVMSGVY